MEVPKDSEPRFVLPYIRVSTGIQASEGASLDNQLKSITEWSEQNGHKIKKIYSDEGKSGRNMEGREQFLLLLNEIQSGEIFVVHSISRFSRSTLDTAITINNLKTRGVYFKALDVVDDGGFTRGLLTLLAERESKVISDRVGQVLNRLSLQGKLKTKPPFGWKFVAKNQPFIKDDDEQKSIQYMKDLAQLDPAISDYKMSQILNQKDIYCGKNAQKWYAQRVETIRMQNGIISVQRQEEWKRKRAEERAFKIREFEKRYKLQYMDDPNTYVFGYLNPTPAGSTTEITFNDRKSFSNSQMDTKSSKVLYTTSFSSASSFPNLLSSSSPSSSSQPRIQEISQKTQNQTISSLISSSSSSMENKVYGYCCGDSKERRSQEDNIRRWAGEQKLPVYNVYGEDLPKKSDVYQRKILFDVSELAVNNYLIIDNIDVLGSDSEKRETIIKELEATKVKFQIVPAVILSLRERIKMISIKN